MKRVVVIGSGGAGKSTFSQKLGDATGLEVIHLDSLYWKPNWQKTPKDEWERTVAELCGRESWIMDGNFGGTRELRIIASDTVIFLDIPRYVCLYRVIKRAIRYRGRTRPDMATGCNEKFDLEFLSWIWNYPNRGGKRVCEEMEKFPEKRFVVLRSSRGAEDFLREGKSDGFSR
jgi:adenylate kinase family enzyme